MNLRLSRTPTSLSKPKLNRTAQGVKNTGTPRTNGSDVVSSRLIFLQRFQQRTGISFKDASLLDTAFTHRSYINEAHTPSDDNERLEFLGDSVLGLCVAHILYERFRDSREGDLARLKSALVSETTLARIAQKLEIGELLHLGKGEEMSGGREKNAILADTLEALLGAYYLDSGIKAVSALIQRLLSDTINALSSTSGKDFKSIMQEYAQKRGHALPVYAIAKSEGPEHARLFYVSCIIASTTIGPLSGRTKKEAEQRVAKKAFELFREKSEEDRVFLDAIAGKSNSLNDPD